MVTESNYLTENLFLGWVCVNYDTLHIIRNILHIICIVHKRKTTVYTSRREYANNLLRRNSDLSHGLHRVQSVIWFVQDDVTTAVNYY